MVIPLALGFLLSREVPGIIRAAKNWKQRLSLLESWLAKNILLIFIIVLMASALFISVSRGGIISFVFSLGLFSLLLGVQKIPQGKKKDGAAYHRIDFHFSSVDGHWPGSHRTRYPRRSQDPPQWYGSRCGKIPLPWPGTFPFSGSGWVIFKLSIPNIKPFIYPLPLGPRP